MNYKEIYTEILLGLSPGKYGNKVNRKFGVLLHWVMTHYQ